MVPQGLPELILGLEPAMRELLRLREEVVALRKKVYLPTPTAASMTVAELLAETPWSLRQQDDGRWSMTMVLSEEMTTGVGGCESDVAALRQAIRHAGDCYQRLQADFEED